MRSFGVDVKKIKFGLGSNLFYLLHVCRIVMSSEDEALEACEFRGARAVEHKPAQPLAIIVFHQRLEALAIAP